MNTVEILGHKYKTPSVEFASRVVQSVRDSSNLGASEMGSEFPIRNADGQQIAYASYNGRIWSNDGELLHEAVA